MSKLENFSDSDPNSILANDKNRRIYVHVDINTQFG